MRAEGKRPAWALAASCITAAVLACWGDLGGGGGESAQPSPPVNVPDVWQLARQAPGHAVHVGKEHIACEQCHSIASGRFDNPGPLPCAACHPQQARIQHASERARSELGPAAQADCTDCHAFASPAVPGPAGAPPSLGPDGGSRDGAWDCGRCHDSQRGGAGSGIAVVAHRGAACAACHTPHGDAPAAPADCAQCHSALSSQHGHVERDAASAKLDLVSGAASTSGACRVCHERMHEPASRSLDGCVECHSTTQPRVTGQALFAGGHERCTSCHTPHAFAPAEAVPCASCHREQPPALASGRVKAHAACESCHTPHDVGADPARACSGCHDRLENDHPGPPGGSACTSCHVAHPPGAGQGPLHAKSTRVPCAECHAGASGDGGFHAAQVACRECHVPHRFERAASDLAPCTRCHAAEVGRTHALGAGHAACQQCHTGLPHDTSAETPACASCHTGQGAHATRGHQACQGCHEPHGGEVKAACESCHAPVLAGAPAGHRACRGCHEPHTGEQIVQGCTSCHAAKAKAPHHGVEGGCDACHSAHGPAAKQPAACTSCHAPSRTGGLHAVAEHQRCSDCHRAHQKQARPEPEACRSCHRDRANHFPDARRCSGCHLFDTL